METKASYVAVGSFVLIVAAGLIVFATWLGKVSIDREFDRYLILFTDSVTGLQVGSAVRYRGVPVGTVSDIRIDPTNVERIQVTVDVARGTPIVTSSIARLALQGITGGSFVEIVGGMQGDGPLRAQPGQALPVIESQPSSLAAVIEGIPDLLQSATRLTEAAAAFVTEKNQQAMSNILNNIDTLTQAFSERVEEINRLIERIDSVATNVDGLVAEIRVDAARLSDRLDTTLGSVNDELVLTGADIRDLAEAFTRAADQATVLIRENRPGVREFTNSGINEFTLMVQELRTLANNLSRVAIRIENDPAQFLFGSSDQGVRVE